jgi:type III pantothenate kinase
MNLAIDIGNSFTHFGIYRSNKLLFNLKIPTHAKTNFKQLHSRYFAEYAGHISKAGISSVVPSNTKQLSGYIKKYMKIMPLIINNKNRLPIKIKVKNSNSLGADRICYAVYGYEYFNRKENVIICGLGTANTYNIVLKNGDFIGGAIAPGIWMSAIALSLNTGKLPLLRFSDLKFNRSVIGKDTKQAIQSGLMNYSLYATEGMIKAIEKELKRKFKVIITGGLAKVITKKLQVNATYVENAVLAGINLILNYQNKP